MGSLAEELMNELNCETAFTIPVFGGIPVPESVVATWIIMAFLVVASLYLTRNLQIVPTGKRQVFVESCVTFLQDFFTGIFGEHGKRYVPYLGTVLLFIGCANLIGLFGIKPPTKAVMESVQIVRRGSNADIGCRRRNGYEPFAGKNIKTGRIQRRRLF